MYKISKLILTPFYIYANYIGLKPILKNVSGEFRSNELTAIMGPSGSGKTTLINLLAGYRSHKTSGVISINKKHRDMILFRKISRYILQEDHVSPWFTVMETMMFASNLKLATKLTKTQHITEINKILNTLYLNDQANTRVSNLSGGQRKRLCIALELLNTPTVLFLDEPTTGLDEFSATKCLTFLKRLAKTGRTIICSIHAPSAKLFEMFDKVYILTEGQCVYQGKTRNIVPFLKNIGLNCPITYNPADFIIEVANREYGDYHDDMVLQVNNGKTYNWLPGIESEPSQNQYLNLKRTIDEMESKDNINIYHRNTTWWYEYRLLFMHMLQEMWRDKTYIKLKIFSKLFLALFISLVYTRVGTDARIFLYNYHFVFITSFLFVFVSLSPMLSHIPLEMNNLRREYFNQWYRLSSYFMALLTTKLPDMIVLGLMASALLYFITGQPAELYRFLSFLLIIVLTSMTSSSLGLVVSSRLNLLNTLFVGPYVVAFFTIFGNYSVGNPNMSTLENIMMYSSFIRHSVEGLMATLFDDSRSDPICPPEEIFCMMKKPQYLLKLVGFENLNYARSVLCLIGFYTVFNIWSFFNFKSRLSSFSVFGKNRSYQYFKNFLKKYCYFKLF